MTDTQRDRYEARRLAHAPNQIDWKLGGFSLRCGECDPYEDWPCSTAELALERVQGEIV